MAYRHAMPLTRSDLERIRTIVKEEIRNALASKRAEMPPTTNERETSALRQQALDSIARMRREAAARAARPIPEGPFVDRYDAARLLGVTMDTVTSWVRSGRLSKHKANGKLQVMRSEIDLIVATRPKR